MDTNDTLKNIVSNLPDSPGVYQYFNADQQLLYVGKAKNLKKRVSSYFNKTHDTARITVMVRQIAEIKTILKNVRMIFPISPPISKP